ncbi:hypothetical protein [Kitasatospora sp. NPDC087271]|uniref:hypothetical protein n=1 Tax=Kitasatospora sp. NPDC087271 TaxID=3364067 RepID=UPI0038214BC1
MTEPTATPQLPSSPAGSAAGTSSGPAAQKSLLEQLHELLASVSADLAELQSPGIREDGPATYPTGTDTASSDAPATPDTR